jgi:hypothetical protein
MQDLSHLAENSMTVTSQAAGNMTSGRPAAMSAPGSQPVDPLPPTQDQDDPNMTMSPEIPVSFTGHPAPKAAESWTPPAARWGPVVPPDVTREPAPAPPPVEGHAGTASIGVAGPARGVTTGRPAGTQRAVHG